MSQSPDKIFLTSAQVRARYGGVSDMWIHRRLLTDAEFPKPTYFGRRRFWRIEELDGYDLKKSRRSAAMKASLARKEAASCHP